MRTTLVTFAVSILILCASCAGQNSDNQGKVYTIDLEQCMAKEQAMRLSEIADTLEYMELKTPEEIVITRILDIIPYGDFLIIYSRDGLFKFTKDGEFVTILANQGQGPGEYNMIFGVDVDPVKKELIITDSGKTMYYDLDGRFLRERKTGNLFSIALSDTTLWVAELAHRTVRFIAFALNQEGDTIFKLSGKERIPYIHLNMGKYKLPIEYEPWYSNEAFLKNGYRYWAIPSIVEDDRFLYLLTQRCSSPTGNNFVHDEGNFRYILFDKEKQEGFVTNSPDGTRFIDDYLGGPAFWPRWSTDDCYMNVIEWYDLSQEIKNGAYTLSTAFKKQFDSWGMIQML